MVGPGKTLGLTQALVANCCMLAVTHYAGIQRMNAGAAVVWNGNGGT